MTKIISEAEYQEKWYDLNKNTQYPDPLDSSDIIYSCPEQFGIGYDHYIELRDISLLIRNQQYHDDLQIAYEAGQDEFEEIEFGFNISGSYSSNRLDRLCNRGGRENFLQWDFYSGEYAPFVNTSFSRKGRGQRAEGRRDLFLPRNARTLWATGGSQGFKPPTEISDSVACNQCGFEAHTARANLLPSASCLLPSSLMSIY